jgi:hypothetical protein
VGIGIGGLRVRKTGAHDPRSRRSARNTRRFTTPGGYHFKRQDLSNGRVKVHIVTPEGLLVAAITLSSEQWKEFTE